MLYTTGTKTNATHPYLPCTIRTNHRILQHALDFVSVQITVGALSFGLAHHIVTE